VGPYQCSSLLLTGLLQTQTSDNKFTDLVMQTSGPYGVPLVIGRTLYTSVTGCTAMGGIYGIARFPYPFTYYNRIYDCTLFGSDAAYLGDSDLVTFRDITVPNSGRSTFRFIGCGVEMKGVRVGNYGNDPQRFVSFYSNTYGAGGTFEDISLDLEGGSPLEAAFYVEDEGDNPTVLRVRDFYAGSLGTGAVFFKLRCLGSAASYWIAYLDVETVIGDAPGGIVDVDGANWIGEIRNVASDYGPYVTSSQAFGRPRIKILDDRSMSAPRYGNWFAGTVKLTPPGPADGQYRELQVAGDGTHGSSSPPQWIGLDAIQANPNASLAAYAIDHTAIAATLSGQATSWGRVTAYIGGVGTTATLFGNPSLGSSVRLLVSGTGLGGTFTLSYGGQTTSGLSPTATAATIQTALQGLASINGANVTVSSPAQDTQTLGATAYYTVQFTGTLANTAGAALGLTVNGSGLTSTGPSVIASGSAFTFYGATGGTFTLTAGSKTTSALAWNADGPTVLAALLAAGIAGQYGVANMVKSAIPGSYYQFLVSGTLSINAAGLTGGASAAIQADPTNTWSIPPTYYAALLTTPAYGLRGSGGEPSSGSTGYHRVSVANNTTTFGASSAGSKTSGAAITFPTATAPYTVNAISFFPSTSNTNGAFLTLQLATPLVVAQGTTPTINLGALTFTHTPYTGSFAGGMTDYAWGKVFDLLFGGVSFTAPATYYAALSTAALSRTTTTLAEPSGNGYARATIANNPTNWLVPYSNDFLSQAGDARNGVAVAFPAPTGSWGSCVGTALADAPSGGNVWFVAQLTAPVAPAAGTHAPTFSAGAFTLATV
jgi:hypothetical protein